MTTEVLMVHALHRGLGLSDFKILSVGMILDYIVAYDRLCGDSKTEEKEVRLAEQNEFNEF